jgi:hypothetical protein
MSPTQFSIALRNRLFVQHPMVHSSLRCKCDQTFIDEMGYHVHLCNCFSGYRINTHNAIVDTLASMLKNAGILHKKEIVIAKEKRYDKDKDKDKENLILETDKRRLDIVTKIPVSLLDETTSKLTSIDVTVVNAARNYKNLTNEVATTIALEANKQEDFKISKYHDLVNEYDYHIIPFALEVQGQYGANTKKVFNKLVDLVLINSRAKRSTILDYWAKRFSITLQKGVSDHLFYSFQTLIRQETSLTDTAASNLNDTNDHPMHYHQWFQSSQY